MRKEGIGEEGVEEEGMEEERMGEEGIWEEGPIPLKMFSYKFQFEDAP